MTYSKKQMKPLLDKYGINPETNQLFIDVCTMFDGQPNYQVWAVKMIFSKTMDMGFLSFIANWANENQQLIKSLSKANIIPYSTPGDIKGLVAEIQNLNTINEVKNIISMFNTTQKGLLESYCGIKHVNSLNLKSRSDFLRGAEILQKFNKLPGDRKKNFIIKNSAVKSLDALLSNLQGAITTSYGWNREDLLAFVSNNFDDVNVIYDNGNNIVILQVKSYKSSKTLCGGGRTSWCITTSSSQWDNYVGSKNNQFFFFDFSKPETDELAHIGFTVTKDNGITHAHSTKDSSLMGGGIRYGKGNVNIYDVFNLNAIPRSVFMPFKGITSFKWDMASFAEFAKNNKSNFSIVFAKNNIAISKIVTKGDDKKRNILKHAYFNTSMPWHSDLHEIYFLYDFNKDMTDDFSTIIMTFSKDKYGVLSVNNIYDLYGTDITKEKVLATMDIRIDDFIKRDSINPNILLHKLIDEGDEKGAIELIEKNGSKINVNYAFNDRLPILGAMQQKMNKLFEVIINNENFVYEIHDEFEDSLLTSLLDLYTCDAIVSAKNNEEALRDMIGLVLKAKTTNLNEQDFNLDTPVNIACEYPQLSWLALDLINRPIVDVNVINDCNGSALSNAINNPDKEVLRTLGKRPDLIVRDEDRQEAKLAGINLNDYIKPEPMVGLDEIVRPDNIIKPAQRDFMEIFERALRAYAG